MHICNICDYSTYDKSNINHHNQTKKHIRNKLNSDYINNLENYKNNLGDNNNKTLIEIKDIKIIELNKKIKNLEDEKIKNLEDEKIKNLEHERLRNLEHGIIKNLKNEKAKLEKYIEILLHNKRNNTQVKKYKKKCLIPAVIKNSLWNKYFSDKNTGKCCCCNIETISSRNFDCGHIISEHNGGIVSLDNLKPICRLCNSSMSTTNMDEFISKYKLNSITIQ